MYFNNPRTTISAVITVLAWLLARYGFELPLDVQMAITLIGIALIGAFSKDAAAPEEIARMTVQKEVDGTTTTKLTATVEEEKK